MGNIEKLKEKLHKIKKEYSIKHVINSNYQFPPG